MDLPQVDAVQAAIGQALRRLEPVDEETIPAAAAAGRILAAPLTADRDSPAVDVSAMDGYAFRREDYIHTRGAEFDVASVAAAGSPPVDLPPGKAVQIFTGAPLPRGADCVVRREDTLESHNHVAIRLRPDDLFPGQNIRRRGENIAQGKTVLAAGQPLHPAALGAVASFSGSHVSVRRRVRVVILNTGDELAAMGQPVQPWQIRDSNGPLLASWLGCRPWIEVVDRRWVADALHDVARELDACCRAADAVIVTGGVSMGDADFVPDAIRQIGGQVVFHRLPMRPGRPVLAAIRNQQLILGLPGNPVSVAVTARVIGLPLLERLAGAHSTSATLSVWLEEPDDQTLDLIWYRLVEHDGHGRTRLVTGRGSGDVVALARSAGVIEVPLGGRGAGPWRLLSW